MASEGFLVDGVVFPPLFPFVLYLLKGYVLVSVEEEAVVCCVANPVSGSG